MNEPIKLDEQDLPELDILLQALDRMIHNKYDATAVNDRAERPSA